MNQPVNRKLLHLSYAWDAEVSLFVPRVPDSRGSTEDAHTARVCVSTTIEGCMIAHPSVFHRFLNAYLDGCEYPDGLDLLLEHGKTGFLMRLYEFDAHGKRVLTPDQLHENGLVDDALDTDEHWILESCQPIRTRYVLLEGMEPNTDAYYDPDTDCHVVNTDFYDFHYTVYESAEEAGLTVPYDDYLSWLGAQGLLDRPLKPYNREKAANIIAQLEARFPALT